MWCPEWMFFSFIITGVVPVGRSTLIQRTLCTCNKNHSKLRWNRYSWYTNHVCIIVLGYWCLTSYFWPQPYLLIYVPGVSWPFLYNATAIGAVWLELWWWWSWWRWNKRSKMLWPCVVAVDPPPLHPVKVITSSPDFMATAQLHVAREEELHLAYLACT